MGRLSAGSHSLISSLPEMFPTAIGNSVPLVRQWEPELVYLVQMPRAGSVPNLCGETLELETWLRMASIPYRQNVDNQFRLACRGQTPFVELNGSQLAGGSRAIIDHLSKHFCVHMDEWLSELSRADVQAWQALVEHRLGWLCLCLRSMDNAFYADPAQGIGAHLVNSQQAGVPGKFNLFRFKHFMLRTLRKEMRKQCGSRGMDRQQTVQLAEADLRALSVFLAEKPFLLGEQPCSLDAAAFGQLAQFHFCPGAPLLKALFRDVCSNLGAYLMRIRADYWPDWAQATGTQLRLDNGQWRRHKEKLEALEEAEERAKHNWAFRTDI